MLKVLLTKQQKDNGTYLTYWVPKEKQRIILLGFMQRVNTVIDPGRLKALSRVLTLASTVRTVFTRSTGNIPRRSWVSSKNVLLISVVTCTRTSACPGNDFCVGMTSSLCFCLFSLIYLRHDRRERSRSGTGGWGAMV